MIIATSHNSHHKRNIEQNIDCVALVLIFVMDSIEQLAADQKENHSANHCGVFSS